MNRLSEMIEEKYRECKQTQPNVVLIFREGDYYTVLGDDAKIVANLFNLAVWNHTKSENPLPSTGFPFWQIGDYSSKLIKAGYHISIIE